MCIFGSNLWQLIFFFHLQIDIFMIHVASIHMTMPLTTTTLTKRLKTEYLIYPPIWFFLLILWKCMYKCVFLCTMATSFKTVWYNLFWMHKMLCVLNIKTVKLKLTPTVVYLFVHHCIKNDFGIEGISFVSNRMSRSKSHSLQMRCIINISASNQWNWYQTIDSEEEDYFIVFFIVTFHFKSMKKIDFFIKIQLICEYFREFCKTVVWNY